MLVVGAGSIGRRHIRNLSALGIEGLTVCDPDAERLRQLSDDAPVRGFSDFNEAIERSAPQAVFVCTPPVYHLKQTLTALEAGAHVFVEKPLSHTLDGVQAVMSKALEKSLIVQVGYNLRFNPGLGIVKRLVDEGRIGRVLWAHVEAGQYLPDWRPWQDYRKSYTARRELGGGIILDASHELDYTIWILGMPTEVCCMAGKVSGLELDVEDCATILLKFPGGERADVHLDCIQRSYTKTCKLAGENGTLVWNYSTNEVQVYSADAGSWEHISYDFEANDMYVAEISHFLECIEQEKTPLVTLADGEKTLKVISAANRSAERGAVEIIQRPAPASS
jgi:predicted dehydrogenase